MNEIVCGTEFKLKKLGLRSIQMIFPRGFILFTIKILILTDGKKLKK